MNKYKKSDYVGVVIVAWILYSLIVGVAGSVSWWPEKHSDGWYVMMEECENDGHGERCWEYKADGPYSKSEIDRMYEIDSRDADENMRKYGTVYNISHNLYNEGGFFFAILGFIVHLFFLAGLPYIFYEITKK